MLDAITMSGHEIEPALASTTSEFRVRFCETDLMGIVHHASYLPYFELGRVEWLRRRGVLYRDWAQSGIHLPLVDAACKYIKPAMFDDLLHVTATLDELRVASVRFSYVIMRGEERLVTGSTRLACVNAEHRPVRIPPFVLDVLRAAETTTG